MRLPNGKLKRLSDQTGLKKQYLNSVIRRAANVSKTRALFLATSCEAIGVQISAEDWIFATEDYLKKRLSA